MQNKGFIKGIAILFALACLFHLSFTFVTARVEKKARAFAYGQETEMQANALAGDDLTKYQFLYDSISRSKEVYYLDSMSNQIVYNILIRKYTYKEVKERELNLGLDLKGGMNVTLQVAVSDIIVALSGHSQNPVFVEAIERAKLKERNSQEDFVALFGQAINEIDPNFQLASLFMAEFKDKINFNSTNEDVLRILSTETNQAIDRTFNILHSRIDRFGVTQPNIQKLQTAGRILVELPGIKEPDRVRKLLQGTAQLEFWETYKFPDLYNYFEAADSKLVDILKLESEAESKEEADSNEEIITDEELAETTEAAEETIEDVEITEEADTTQSKLLDEIGDATSDTQTMSSEELAKTNPLFAYLRPNLQQTQGGGWAPAPNATVGFAQIKDTARINNYLRKINKDGDAFPRNLKLAWKVKPEKWAPDLLELVALKVTSRDGTPALDGGVIVDARQDFEPTSGRVEVTMLMNSEGARIWKQLTGDNIGNQIAIVLDDYVYSAPNVNDEIPSGRSSITGNFEVAEAQDLANILKAGKLPAQAHIVEEAIVGPSLGRIAVTNGLISFVLAFLMVLAYMALYYNKAGWVANLTLLTNILFIFGVLASLGAVLTLSGIAGIVLTLGMAVDANVIIFERIKEEIRAGKGAKLALSDGYKNSYSAIIDGNVTTLLTGIVLYIFGSGPVQGFATTLIIGIVSSLFSAIFISRLVFDYLLSRNKSIAFGNSLTMNVLSTVNINFLGMRKKAYIFSAAIIFIGLVSLATRGLNYGVDFSGGRTYVVRFDQPVNTNEIREALVEPFEQQPEVKTFGPTSQVKITTKYNINDNSPVMDSIIQRKLFESLNQFYNDKSISYDEFVTVTDSEKLTGILSSQKVGPTIASDIRNRAVLSVVFALIIMFIYIAIRFKRWQFGLSGVIALFHNAMITISLFSLFYNVLPFNLEIDQAFIAAILTIIGYSINDTVIIFDRIREHFSLYPKRTLMTNINDGINSTLSRTINTGGTTLVVLLMIFIFGGEVIRGFAFALFVGILIGTYSSIFLASTLAYDLLSRKKVKVKTKA